MDLCDWRNEIDEIDRGILKLLKLRAGIVAKIGQAKAIKGMPLIDKKREEEIMSRIGKDCDSVLSAEAAQCVFRCIIEESRRIQAALIEQTVELC